MHKILYLHSSNELYGADRSLLRLVKYLDRAVYLPEVVLPNDLSYEGLLTSELKKADVAFDEMKLGVLRRLYWNASGMLLLVIRTIVSSLKLAIKVRRQNIELIHSNTTAVLGGGLVARLTGIPHIWHVREIITSPAWFNRLMANLLQVFSDRVIAVSGPVKDKLVSTQPRLERKIWVIHNGIDPTPFLNPNIEIVKELRRCWSADEDTVVIGMIGRISAWKGQEFLLQAAAPLARNKANIRIVLVGGSVPGEVERKTKLQEFIGSLGLQDFLYLEDFRLDIPNVLAAFDIFVLPSIRPDPFPTVVLEAMAAAKPVIATAHGGAIEQVDDGNTGILVSPTDPDAMGAALNQLVSSKELRVSMGQAGRARVLSKFTLERYLANITSVYQEFLSPAK